MKILSREDYNLYKALCQRTQNELLTFLPAILNKYNYTNIKKTSDYIIAEGTIPILLCAHLDTVGQNPPEEIYYDKEAGVIWSPNLCGADDRAGVFAIIKILQKGLRPCICFTTNEEQGGLGAEVLGENGWPYTKLKFILQLDRRNTGEVVYYDLSSELPFCEYIESFGFTEAIGSFSDVSFLAPYFNVAGCNLSVGYVDEHTKQERLFVNGLLYTIDRVCKILQDDNAPWTEYIESPNSLWTQYSPGWDDEWDYPVSNMRYICHNCGKLVDRVDAFPVKLIKGGTGYYCSNCLCDPSVSWCDYCGKAFETNPENPDYLCPDCRKSLTKKGKFNGGKRNSSKGRSNEKN